MSTSDFSNNFNNLFPDISKPLIGMIHLPALPGSPSNTLSIAEILNFALKDLSALLAGGIHGVLVENHFDSPFLPYTVDALTISSMAIIVKEIADRSAVPVGVNILRNACLEATAVAACSSGDFIRCNFWTGSYVTDQGIINGCAHEVKRFQNIISKTSKCSVPLIFADVHCKFSSPLSTRPLEFEVSDAFSRGKADAVIISGEKTGLPARIDDLTTLQKENLHPIIIGSGVSESNINKLLPLADGAIIGTALKIDNQIDNAVDVTKVKKLVKLAEKL